MNCGTIESRRVLSKTDLTCDSGPSVAEKDSPSMVEMGNLDPIGSCARSLSQTEIQFVFSREFEARAFDDAELREIARLTSQYDYDADHDGNPHGGGDHYRPVWHASATPLLDLDEERLLFRRMNYVKYRANVLRSRINSSEARVGMLDETDGLLKQADRIRTRIASSNLRLVHAIAGKLAWRVEDCDDLISEGSMILLKAIDRFDYSRGFRFSTYATHSIQRHLWRILKRETSRRQRLQLVPPVVIDRTVNAPAIHRDVDYDAVCREVMSAAVDCLDDREREVVLLRFGLGGTAQPRKLAEIATQFGISRERVRQLQLRAVKKVRRAVAHKDVDVGDRTFGLPVMSPDGKSTDGACP